jgi:hypothetical protein
VVAEHRVGVGQPRELGSDLAHARAPVAEQRRVEVVAEQQVEVGVERQHGVDDRRDAVGRRAAVAGVQVRDERDPQAVVCRGPSRQLERHLRERQAARLTPRGPVGDRAGRRAERRGREPRPR